MKKQGLTLIELIVAIILSSVLLLAMASQFIATVRFSAALQNKTDVTREALIVTNHMARILRFADPTTIVPDLNTNRITATIKGNHIALFPNNDTPCYYRLDGTGFYFSNNGNEILLSKYVTYFDTNNDNTVWDVVNHWLTLKITVTKNGVNIPMETKIKVIGDLP